MDAHSVKDWSWVTARNIGWLVSVSGSVIFFLWLVVRPHAEEFVRESVRNTVQMLQDSDKEQRVQLGEIKNRQAIQNEKLQNIEKLQKEIRDILLRR